MKSKNLPYDITTLPCENLPKALTENSIDSGNYITDLLPIELSGTSKIYDHNHWVDKRMEIYRLQTDINAITDRLKSIAETNEFPVYNRPPKLLIKHTEIQFKSKLETHKKALKMLQKIIAHNSTQLNTNMSSLTKSLENSQSLEHKLSDFKQARQCFTNLQSLEKWLQISWQFKNSQLEAGLNASYFLQDANKLESWINIQIGKIDQTVERGPIPQNLLEIISKDLKNANDGFSTVFKLSKNATRRRQHLQRSLYRGNKRRSKLQISNQAKTY
jgi:hypothetical protein